MKKILILLLTALFSTLTLAQVIGPKLSVKDAEYDFGDLMTGQVVTHYYEIMNSGDEILKIEKVRASCGCTAAQPEKNELKPGESTKVKVDFDTANRRGIQKKHVYVYSNDQDNKIFRLSFSAKVINNQTEEEVKASRPRLLLSTRSHNFGTIEEGKVVDLKIGFHNAGKEILKIQSIKTSCSCTAALLSRDELKAGESGSMEIKLDTSGRTGRLTRTITVFSNDPVEAKQTITLFVNIEKREG